VGREIFIKNKQSGIPQISSDWAECKGSISIKLSLSFHFVCSEKFIKIIITSPKK
jgi:hypothetical protein